MLGQPPCSHSLSQEHGQGSPAQLLPRGAHGSHANVPQDLGGWAPTALVSSSLLALLPHREPLCCQLPSKEPPF